MPLRSPYGALLFVLLGMLLPGMMPPALWSAARAEDIEFYERHIRPILVEHCYSCHSADAEEP